MFQIINTCFSLSSLRYSLTDEGLALAERLESVEHKTKDGPEGEQEEAKSDAEEEEDVPCVVDLTGSDDGEESEDSSSRHSLKERLACVSETDGAILQEKAQIPPAMSRKPNAGCLLPGSYEIILCVDFIETTG